MTNPSSLVDRCLGTIRQAESLQRDILAALSDGDREKAENLCLQHQQLIETLPLRDFTDPLPEEVRAALQGLLAGNEELVRITTDIQDEIRKQLGEVSRGKHGSQVYHDIDRHQ